jgi:heterodisulfide reductase subunit B
VKKHYKMFWGCTIPAQLPFIEKAARRVLEHFNVLTSDLEGTTCCPEKLVVADDDHEKYLLTAARNLALAEREGRDIMVACNGCYATLKTALETIKADKALCAHVNERLSRIGLSLAGTINVHHMAGVLEDDVRVPRIKKEARRPLAGLRVAVHYGCNMLRPASALQLDDPLNPTLLDRLVEALGGVSVNYASKMACCGGNSSLVDAKEQSDAMLRRKISDAGAAGADFLLVACPACFTQFDFRQDRMMRDAGAVEDEIPVLHLAELVDLVLGNDPDEQTLKRRRVKLEPVLEKWRRLREVQAALSKDFDLKSLARCAACGACVKDCPVCAAWQDFNPNDIVQQVLSGDLDKVLAEGRFWNCLDCLTCYELCPQRFGMQSVFSRLKELAREKGLVPESMAKVREAFNEKGRIVEGSAGLRKRYGLCDLPAGGEKDLKRLLEEEDK